MKRIKKYLFETNEKFTLILDVLMAILIAISVAFIKVEMNKKYIVLIIVGVLLSELIFLLVSRINHVRKESGLYQLEKWLQYDKKRREIEQQMEVLSLQLIDSDMSSYIDLNRLIFDGQSMITKQTFTDYDSFLQQFGLEKKAIKVKENSAAFLTPFNVEGERLYRKCQTVLLDMGIVLQRSDNYVDKDDILMNIISLIVQSKIIIVNIDGRNPNVYYELGIAHALGKPTILLSRRKGNKEPNDVGFDIRQKRIILYNTFDDLETKLLYQINNLNKGKTEELYQKY